jgi:hypothetical protein
VSALRDAADRIAKMGRFVTLSHDRRLETEKAADWIGALATDVETRERTQEEWDDFLRRIGVIGG